MACETTYVRRLDVSSPGRRLRSRLARFAAVSRQGAPRSKSTRLPDPAASPHQFLHDRSEYKVYLRHNYDSTWRAIRACANAVTIVLTLYHSYYSPRSRCHKILGPPWIWGPPGPISLGYWGPLWESGAPFGAKSMRTAYGSTVRYVSAAVNKTKRTNFPTHFGV